MSHTPTIRAAMSAAPLTNSALIGEAVTPPAVPDHICSGLQEIAL